MDTLSLKVLVASPTNPRRSASKAELKELASSIASQGMLQPLVVRKLKNNGHYEIIAGHRRFQAAEMLGLKSVPVNIVNADDQAAAEMQIVENLQRSDVDPLDEAEGFKRLFEKGMSIKDLSSKIGKSRTYVADRMVLANLTNEYRNLLKNGRLSLGEAALIGRLTPEQQRDAYSSGLLGGDTDWLRRKINERYFTNLARVPFDTASPTLVPPAGACTKCQKRSSANSDLFGRVVDGDSCLDAGCLSGKLRAFLEEKKAALKAKGPFVLISTEHRASEGVLPRGFPGDGTGWFKPEKDPVTGLIVESANIEAIGKTMKVSLTSPASHGTEAATKREIKAKEEAREKRHELEMTKRIRALMFRKLWEGRASQKKSQLEKFYALLQFSIHRSGIDTLRAVTRALEVPVIRRKGELVSSEDYAKSLIAWFSEFTNDDLYQMALLLPLAGDLLVHEWSENGAELTALAKLYGIEEKECRRELIEGDRREKEEKEAARRAAREANSK